MTESEINKEAAKFFPPQRYPFGLAFSQDDVVAFAQHCVEIERERIRRLIADDANACEFQSMGQYRSALLRRLQPLPQAPEAA